MLYRTDDQTNWSPDLIEHSTRLIGLEHHTGADLLITTENTLLTNLPDPLPMPIAMTLKKIINHGLLVQVKIGRDFTSSIPDLSSILYKMKQWSSRPWLLIVADVKKDHDGNAIIDGQDCGFTWNEVQGSIDWWQLRGGMVNPFPMHVSDILQWCEDWLPRLTKLQEEKPHLLTRPVSQFIFPVDGRADVLSRLMSPGFTAAGVKTAIKLLTETGSLKHALMYLSDPENCRLCHIEDVGEKRFETFRRNVELDDDQILLATTKE